MVNDPFGIPAPPPRHAGGSGGAPVERTPLWAGLSLVREADGGWWLLNESGDLWPQAATAHVGRPAPAAPAVPLTAFQAGYLRALVRVPR